MKGKFRYPELPLLLGITIKCYNKKMEYRGRL